jgi:hypothetical protein
MFPKSFYLCPKHVFRLGNASTPKLSNIRPHDVDLTKVNDVVVVVANNAGVSVFNEQGLAERDMSGWVWQFNATTPMPQDLKLVHDRPGHYTNAPTVNMPLDKYKGLLEELRMKAFRAFFRQGKQA